MSISKPRNCGMCFNCTDELKIYSPPGNLIGVISEGCGIIRPKYQILDAMLPDSPLFDIRGPICTFSCLCEDVDFEITETGLSRSENKKIGVISKHWGGIEREFLTDSDSFGVSFPKILEPKHKALFLAACFLIVSIPSSLDTNPLLTISFYRTRSTSRQ